MWFCDFTVPRDPRTPTVCVPYPPSPGPIKEGSVVSSLSFLPLSGELDRVGTQSSLRRADRSEVDGIGLTSVCLSRGTGVFSSSSTLPGLGLAHRFWGRTLGPDEELSTRGDGTHRDLVLIPEETRSEGPFPFSSPTLTVLSVGTPLRLSASSRCVTSWDRGSGKGWGRTRSLDVRP